MRRSLTGALEGLYTALTLDTFGSTPKPDPKAGALSRLGFLLRVWGGNTAVWECGLKHHRLPA